MIVLLSSHAPPQLTDVERLDRLHAVGSIGDAVFDDLCQPGPDNDHVWLVVDELGRRGGTLSDDEAFREAFDAMIAYAGSKGWLSDDHTRVRAHVEPAS